MRKPPDGISRLLDKPGCAVRRRSNTPRVAHKIPLGNVGELPQSGLPVIETGGPFSFHNRQDRMHTDYIERMSAHWSIGLGCAPSQALLQGWQQLELAVAQSLAGAPHWQVLSQPTGSGKTEAMKVLFSAEKGYQRGILIVTKFQDEATSIAEDINRYAQKPIARALHGEAPAEGADLSLYSVLVITHSAYRLALIELADHGYSPRMDRYTQYHHAGRQCLVIDEAFDWVDAYDLNLSQLRSMSGDLSGVVQKGVRADVQRLFNLAVQLTGTDEQARPDQNLTAEQFHTLENIDLERITEEVKKLPSDAIVRWSNAEEDSAKDQTITEFKPTYLNLLQQLRTIARIGFAWRSRRHGLARLHSSRSLLDYGLRGIILDATADIDPTYELMGMSVQLLPRPKGMRRYDNVTLHASLGHKVGKHFLSKVVDNEWSQLWGQLADKLANNRTLVCAHQIVLSKLEQFVQAGCAVEFTNWGNIDGRNKWSHCDTVVLFGLPYLDNIVPAHGFFAFNGPQPDNWFAGERRFADHEDIRRVLVDGYIAKSVVQAINRARCRAVIDEEESSEGPNGGKAGCLFQRGDPWRVRKVEVGVRACHTRKQLGALDKAGT